MDGNTRGLKNESSHLVLASFLVIHRDHSEIFRNCWVIIESGTNNDISNKY